LIRGERSRHDMPAIIDRNTCTGCGTCAEVCPQGAIHVDQVAVVDAARCAECGVCAQQCPNQAITVVLEPEAQPGGQRGTEAPAPHSPQQPRPVVVPGAAAGWQRAEPPTVAPTAGVGENLLASALRAVEQVVGAFLQPTGGSAVSPRTDRPAFRQRSVRRCGGGGGRGRRHRRGW